MDIADTKNPLFSTGELKGAEFNLEDFNKRIDELMKNPPRIQPDYLGPFYCKLVKVGFWALRIPPCYLHRLGLM